MRGSRSIGANGLKRCPLALRSFTATWRLRQPGRSCTRVAAPGLDNIVLRDQFTATVFPYVINTATQGRMNLTAFDLNLLVVFEAILRERSVTKAGERLGLSQPAMSHALNRLRWMLKDQLFIRTPEGMAPTPRAEQLADPLRRAPGDLRSALDPEEFIPAQAERRFSVAVKNYAAVVLAGPIAGRMCSFGSECPRIDAPEWNA